MRSLRGALLMTSAAVVILEIVALAALWASGRLDGRKLEQIAAVMQGRGPAIASLGADEAAPRPAEAAPASQPTAAGGTVDVTRRQREVEWLEAQVNHLRQQAQLVLADLEKRQAAFRQEQQAWLQQRQQEADRLQQEAHETLKRVLDTMRPRDAKNYLMEWPEDVVVRLLRDMEDRKVGRILAECKEPEERQKAAKLMMRLRSGV